MKNGNTNSMEDLIKAFQEAEKLGVGKVGFGDIHKNNTPVMTMRTADKDDLYYDAMDALEDGDFKNAEKLLIKAQNLDKDYVQTYIGFTNLYGFSRNKKKLERILKLHFIKL
jgi:hypothetical protein